MESINSIINFSKHPINDLNYIQECHSLIKKNSPLILENFLLDKSLTNIFNEAKLLESAGAFSMVLECVESSLAKIITKNVNIPTIGIGASANCDGQVLVTDDLLGLNPINVRFVKKYSNIRKEIDKAVSNYSKEVRKNKFPLKKHSY